MGATDIIAVALAAAILSLLLQFFESGRRREEIHLLRAEAKRRDEEISILRQQIEAEEEERHRHDQAQLAVFAGVQGSGSERGSSTRSLSRTRARRSPHRLPSIWSTAAERP